MIKGESSWQRTKLSEVEYQRLKDAGVPIPDVSSTASWFWRTYDYGERHPTPQELQERIISLSKGEFPADNFEARHHDEIGQIITATNQLIDALHRT